MVLDSHKFERKHTILEQRRNKQAKAQVEAATESFLHAKKESELEILKVKLEDSISLSERAVINKEFELK